MVTLKSMIDCNLLTLHTGLNLANDKWATETFKLRQEFFEVRHHLLSTAEAQIVLAIATLVEPHWRLPLAANLISLLPRSTNDEAIMVCLKKLKLAGNHCVRHSYKIS